MNFVNASTSTCKSIAVVQVNFNEVYRLQQVVFTFFAKSSLCSTYQWSSLLHKKHYE